MSGTDGLVHIKIANLGTVAEHACASIFTSHRDVVGSAPRIATGHRVRTSILENCSRSGEQTTEDAHVGFKWFRPSFSCFRSDESAP